MVISSSRLSVRLAHGRGLRFVRRLSDGGGETGSRGADRGDARGYRLAGGDCGDDALLHFFASYRAWVRAKVACLRARELAERDPERGRAEREAGEELNLGHRLAWRARAPLVLIVCGPSGSGKTTLARLVGGLSGWEHLSSDVTRKRAAGLDPSERGAAGLYSRQRTIGTYRKLGAAAADRAHSARG